MKTILKMILIIIIIAIAVVLYLFRDNPESFTAYEIYRESLSSFETDSGTMRYRDDGEGPVILMVHGVPTNSWMYRTLGDLLVAEGYRVIIPDLMGFGASDAMEEYDDYDFEQQAQHLTALMDGLGIRSWQQVTHDMGGLVTWYMTRDVPRRIDHLYVLNTILYEEGFNPPIEPSYENRYHRWALGLHGHPMVGKLIVTSMLMSGTADRVYTTSEQAGYWLPLRNKAGALVHFFTHIAEVKEQLDEYRSWLVNSGIDVSVVWGEHDPFLDSVSATLLKEEMNLGDEDVVVIEGAKHLIAESSPEVIVEMINQVNR
jgi:haloalkane dehalogenase